VVTKRVRLEVEAVGWIWWSPWESPNHGLDHHIEERRRVALVVEWEGLLDGCFHLSTEASVGGESSQVGPGWGGTDRKCNSPLRSPHRLLCDCADDWKSRVVRRFHPGALWDLYRGLRRDTSAAVNHEDFCQFSLRSS
jgi:hypothetical protein